MPDVITVIERRGQTANLQKGKRLFRARGSLSIADIRAAVYAFADDGDGWQGLAFDDIDLEEVGFKVWDAVVNYSALQLPSGGGGGAPSSLSFDTTGSTRNILYAKEQVSIARASGFDDFDPGLLINVGENGVAGVEVATPIFNFERTVRLLDADVTAPYVTTLYQATGTTNDDVFDIFPKGSVLYRGARGALTGNVWEIAHVFSALKNPDTVTVGGLTVGSEEHPVAAWDYVWTYNLPTEVTGAGGTKIYVPQPKALVHQRLVDSSSFSLLGVV